jgi:hypothetical protein
VILRYSTRSDNFNFNHWIWIWNNNASIFESLVVPSIQILREFLLFYSINLCLWSIFSSNVFHELLITVNILFMTLKRILNIYYIDVNICPNLIVLTFSKFLTSIFHYFQICSMNRSKILNIKIPWFFLITHYHHSHFNWQILFSSIDWFLMK